MAIVINLDTSFSGRRTLYILLTSLKNIYLIISGVLKDEVLSLDLLDSVRHEEWASVLEILIITW